MADGKSIDHIAKEGFVTTSSASNTEVTSVTVPSANAQFHAKGWVTAVDGDNLNPKEIFGANLVCWLRSDLGVSTTGPGNVIKWEDQSGNGNDFSQYTDSNRPSYNTVDPNWANHPSITFSGTDEFLDSESAASTWTFLHNGSGGGLCILMRRSTTGGTTYTPVATSPATGGTGLKLFFNSSDFYFVNPVNGGSSVILSGVGPFGADENFEFWHAYEVARTPDYEIYQNGQQIKSGDDLAVGPSASDPTATCRLGALTDGNFDFAGEIVEIIFFNKYPTLEQNHLLQQYFRARYVQNPKDILGSNLKLWLRSDIGVETDSNDNVTKWNDISGNEHHFSQSIEAIRPAYAGDGYWTKYSETGPSDFYPTIVFNISGTDTRLVSDDNASAWRFLHDGTGGGTAIVYRKLGSESSFQYVMGTSDVTPNTGFRLVIDPTTAVSTYMQAFNGSATMFTMDANLSIQDNKYYIMSEFKNSVPSYEAAIWRNGILDESGNTGSTPSTGDSSLTFQIGAKSDGTVGFDGEILEVIAFDTRLTDNQIAQLNNYFDKRYFDGYDEFNAGPLFVKEIEAVGYVEPYNNTPDVIFGSNLHTWLRSDLGITTVSGAVSAWADQSGNGHNFSQSTAGNRPIYNSSDSNWNNLPSLTFDGINNSTGDFLVSDDAVTTWNFLHNGNGMFMSVIARPNSTQSASNGEIIGTADDTTTNEGARILWQPGSTSIRLQVVNASSRILDFPNTLSGDQNVLIYAAYEEGRSVNEAVIGSQLSSNTANTSGAPSASDAAGTLHIGRNANGTNNVFKGEILEVIVLDTYPNDEQITNLTNYYTYRYVNSGGTYKPTVSSTIISNTIDPDASGYAASIDANASVLRLLAASNGTNEATFYGRLEVDIVETEQVTPLTIFGENLELWLRSDVGVSDDGGVGTWSDVLSGKGRKFSQGTASAKPTYNISDPDWGGLPSLTFDGGDRLNSNDAAGTWSFLHDGTGGGVCVVCRVGTQGGTFSRIFATANTITSVGASVMYATGLTPDAFRMEWGNGSASVATINSSEFIEGSSAYTMFIYEEGRAGNEFLLRTNGNDVINNSGTSPSASDPNGCTIGATPSGSGFFVGDILEVIAFSIYPTADQITSLETYLINRYKLWNPTTIFGDGLEVWLRSDMGVTTNGSKVNAWADQSGNGRNFSQITQGNQPTYIESDSNWGGLPSISFNPNNNNNLVSDDAASTWTYLHDGYGCCTIIVFRQQTTGLEQRIWNTHWTLGPAATGSCLRNTGATTPSFSYIVGSGANVISHSEVRTYDSNFYILTAYENGRAGNEYAVIINDESDGGNDLSAPTSSDPQYTLRIATTPGVTAPFSGEILEFISVSRYPTSDELARIQSYLDNRYGFNEPAAIFGSELELWLRSDYGVVTESNTNRVSQWRDKSGKGRHFSQSTSANKPTINEKDKNWDGLPSLVFDGSNSRLTSDDLSSVWKFLHDGTGGSIIVVYRTSGVTDDIQHLVATGAASATIIGMRMLAGITGDAMRYAVSNGTAYLFNVTNITEGNAVKHWAMQSYEEGRAGNEWAAFKDSATAVASGNSAAAPSASDPTQTLRIGCSATGSEIMEGEIVEVIAVSRYPTTNELTQLAEYMNNRYGI